MENSSWHVILVERHFNQISKLHIACAVLNGQGSNTWIYIKTKWILICSGTLITRVITATICCDMMLWCDILDTWYASNRFMIIKCCSRQNWLNLDINKHNVSVGSQRHLKWTIKGWEHDFGLLQQYIYSGRWQNSCPKRLSLRGYLPGRWRIHPEDARHLPSRRHCSTPPSVFQVEIILRW